MRLEQGVVRGGLAALDALSNGQQPMSDDTPSGEVEVSATDAAPQTVSVQKDPGGDEVAD